MKYNIIKLPIDTTRNNTMKSRIFIFSIILLGLYSCKKETAPESEAWIKFFGGCTDVNEGSVKAIDFLYSASQDKIVSVSIFSEAYRQNSLLTVDYIWLLVTDREGKLLTDIKYNPDDLDGYPKKILETNRNSLLVILNTKQNVDDYQTNDCKIVEIGFDGVILNIFDFIPSNGFSYYIQDAVFNNAGELIVTGLTTNVNTNKNGWSPAYQSIDLTDIYIAKLSENFNVIWERALGYLYTDMGFTIEKADQDYIVTAATDNNSNKSIMKISESGGIVKEYNYYFFYYSSIKSNISSTSYLGNNNVLAVETTVNPLEFFAYDVCLHPLESTTPVSFGPILNDGNFQPNYVKKINEQTALICGKSYSAGAFWTLDYNSGVSVSAPITVGIERSNSNFSSLVKFIQDPQNPNYIFVLGNNEKTTTENTLCSNLMLMRMENPVK